MIYDAMLRLRLLGAFAWLPLLVFLFGNRCAAQEDDIYSTNRQSTIGYDVNDCPLLCDCNGYNVTCLGNVLFPVGIPSWTRHFLLKNATIPQIAMTSLRNLPHVTSITIESTHITRVRACSFAELGNMTSILLRNVTADMVEGNAFSNLENISEVAFIDSKFHTFQSYTFHNLRAIECFHFTRTDISSVHPFTFRNISDVTSFDIDTCRIGTLLKDAFSYISNVTTFRFASSVVAELQCNALTKFFESASTVIITGNRFQCDCNIAWLYEEPNKELLLQSNSTNICAGPDKVKGRDLKELNASTVCSVDKGQGCPKSWLPSIPHTCTIEFDSPLDPGEKVDYPPEYTTTSYKGNSASTQSHSNNLFVLALIGLLLIM